MTPAPRSLSINTRLLVAALVLVLLALPLAGVLLRYNFEQSVTTAFDQRLRSLLNVLVAGVEYDPASGDLSMARSLGDPRFEQVFSGSYWQVSDGNGLALTSRSLWDQRLATADRSGLHIGDRNGPRNQRLRVVERDVELPNLPATLHLAVAASREDLDAEVTRFGRLLWWSLAGLGGLLLAGLALQIRWGLSPLRRIHANLRRVETGEDERLETGFATELNDLAEAMNGVLERDRHLIERGRTAAGNLAHALKTPSSVLRAYCERLPESEARPLLTELDRLDAAVRHHLARASAAGGAPLSRVARVDETLAPVVTGIGRMAERQGLACRAAPMPQGRVRMDPQDLQEIAGNLLENALKWASSALFFRVSLEEERLTMRVADDGPGMTPEQCAEALERGRRLDESRAGSGLGLAIVTELVALYGGDVQLGRADEGGLQVEVSLPVARGNPGPEGRRLSAD
ncbi:sensor histidine kinase [Marinobacter sp. JSM 1782161]|uniref:sensor histidine kinase n=1 Tax=Marinobacter sp. JSM 1782161 TaxID=2685906 RepID=UPI001402129C|nr:HAMP domain-containing sensor histidine kinase [Marinobacter sp. JSM 1782161]